MTKILWEIKSSQWAHGIYYIMESNNLASLLKFKEIIMHAGVIEQGTQFDQMTFSCHSIYLIYDPEKISHHIKLPPVHCE